MAKSPSRAFFSHRPFLGIAALFMLGIWIAERGDIGYLTSFLLLVFCLAGYCFFLFLQTKRKRRSQGFFVTFLALASIFMAGYVRRLQQNPENDPRHIIHQESSITAYDGIVISDITTRKRSQAMILLVQRVRIKGQWREATGKVQCFFFNQKITGLRYGTKLRIQGAPKALEKPCNPHVIDYNVLLRTQGIHHKHSPSKKALEIRGYAYTHSLKAQILRLRHHLIHRAKNFLRDKQTLGIVLALVLGDRSYLDQDVREVYTRSGVMHVLAVSGLHVGLLYALLLLLFYLLGSLFRRPRQYYSLTLVCLWLYAFLTGLSPSVLRAVGMLSLFILARKLQRDFRLDNILGALAFFFCLYHPCILFDVGFQLSFIAVLSIFYLYKPVASLYKPKGRLLPYFWQMTAISLVAQTGTLPISLYYFHFFPTFFLFANWFMLPMTSLLLMLSFVFFSVLWSDQVASLLAYFLKKIIAYTTKYLTFLANLPHTQLGPFYPSIVAIMLFYTWLFFVYWGCKKKHVLYLSAAFLMMCIGIERFIQHQIKREKQEKIVVYDVGSHTVIASIHGDEAILLTDQTLHIFTSYYKYQIKPSLDFWGVKRIKQSPLQHNNKASNAEITQQGIPIYSCHARRIIVLHQAMPKPTQEQTSVIDLLVVAGNISDITPYLRCWKVRWLVFKKNYKDTPKNIEEAEKKNIHCHVIKERGAWQMTAM